MSDTITMEWASKCLGLDQKPAKTDKYIIVNYAGMPSPIVVPPHVQHSDVVIKYKGEVCKPISAGFFSRSAAGIAAYGYSESLNLHSRPEDAAILEMI